MGRVRAEGRTESQAAGHGRWRWAAGEEEGEEEGSPEDGTGVEAGGWLLLAREAEVEEVEVGRKQRGAAEAEEAASRWT